MTRQIVVGIDGSERSQRALEWAASEAETRGARLVVVHAWQVPANAYGAFPAGSVDRGVFESAAAETLRRSLEAVDLPDLEERLVQGSAVTALLDAAEGAELIVLGASRRSGLGELLLGSTSRDVTRRTATPVVLVPLRDVAAA